jgi:GNAT superfamily N-acetyltransferase
MKIKHAIIEDAEEILGLQKLSYISEAEIYHDYTIQPLMETLDEIKQEFLNQIVLKMMNEDKIIGSVRAYAKDYSCYIGKLIVHPAYQNNGIGTKLIKEIEKQYENVKRYELFTGLKSDKNIYLYKKLSYNIFKTVIINDTLSIVYFEKIIA